jgi:cob(I)alamin adenosyltransferase
MSKIYTKKGDDGYTYTGGNQREKKSSNTAKLVGCVDELHVSMGKCCTIFSENFDENETYVLLQSLTEKCLDIGSIIYFINDQKIKEAFKILEEKFLNTTKNIEREIDAIVLPPLKEFITFSNCNLTSITLHETRTKIRQTERLFVEWCENKELPSNIILLTSCLNRLSDLYFTLARKYNKEDQRRSQLHKIF